MVKDQNIAQRLKELLVSEHSNWLWSYNRSKISPENVSDKLVVEKYLSLGDDQELDLLKQAYYFNYLRHVWLANSGAENFGQNFKVAKNVFHIKDPDAYSRRKRQERSRQLARANRANKERLKNVIGI